MLRCEDGGGLAQCLGFADARCCQLLVVHLLLPMWRFYISHTRFRTSTFSQRIHSISRLFHHASTSHHFEALYCRPNSVMHDTLMNLKNVRMRIESAWNLEQVVAQGEKGRENRKEE